MTPIQLDIIHGFMIQLIIRYSIPCCYSWRCPPTTPDFWACARNALLFIVCSFSLIKGGNSSDGAAGSMTHSMLWLESLRPFRSETWAEKWEGANPHTAKWTLCDTRMLSFTQGWCWYFKVVMNVGWKPMSCSAGVKDFIVGILSCKTAVSSSLQTFSLIGVSVSHLCKMFLDWNFLYDWMPEISTYFWEIKYISKYLNILNISIAKRFCHITWNV